MMWLFLILLATHFVADFLCQTHWQASNKSKDNIALSRHVASYALVLAIVSLWIVPIQVWVQFVLVNAALHWATDYCTSRWSSKLYAKQDWHNFFCVIGLDQLIHQATLASTLALTQL